MHIVILSPSTISRRHIGHVSSSSFSFGSEFVLLDDDADCDELFSACWQDFSLPSVIGNFLPLVNFAILL